MFLRTYTQKLSTISRLYRSALHRQSFSFSSERKQPDDVDRDVPLKYTTSKAHDHSPFETFLSPTSTAPWYQPYIILMSCTVFLVYFCVLREENDLDQELGRSLFEKIPGLEEKSMLAGIRNAKDGGEDTTERERQLIQLRKASTGKANWLFSFL